MTPNPQDHRALKLPCTRAEFGLWVWAARARNLNVTAFGQAAVREAVRAAVKDCSDRGLNVPQWVAEGLRDFQTRP